MDINDLFGPIAANDNDVRECPQCGSSVTGRQDKKFCCRSCKETYKSNNRDHAAAHARRKATAPERECEWCFAVFRRNRGNKNAARFCSRLCASEQTKAASAVVSAARVSYTVKRCICVWCGVRFNGRSITAVYCSDSCEKARNNERSRDVYAANDNVDRTPRPCAECGNMFSPEYGSKRSVYCTDTCRKRASGRATKGMRDKRIKSTEVERVHVMRVLERDGWKCQICGIDTPREKRGTYEPDAPEMDHIIPLAKGGAHTYDNVQCACRACNAGKGDAIPDAA